jgi:hypothetical protein
MAANPLPQGTDSPTRERTSGAIVRRELLILGICAACGFVLMPLLIWFVGNRALGPYTHGQDTSAGTGPMRLLADFFGGLGHGWIMFWCVAVGPYVLVSCVRLLYSLLRSPPAADLGRG